MQDFVRKIQASIGKLLSREPASQVPGASGMDWVPPVIGPSDWSLGVMADRNAAWYFEQR